jgi:hypothetical protein
MRISRVLTATVLFVALGAASHAAPPLQGTPTGRAGAIGPAHDANVTPAPSTDGARPGTDAAPSDPEAAPRVDGAQYDDDASMPVHAEAVADYEIRASLDPAAHRVHGEGSIKWRNASAVPVRELWVHLYLNAFKNERSAWLREPVGGFRGSDPVRDWGFIDVRRFALRGEEGGSVDLWPEAELHRAGDDDETDVRVPLPREIAPNETITLDMVWDDKLPSVVERTGYLESFHMVAQWFPKLARLEPDGRWAHFPFHHLAEFYADYGTYDVTIDVPQAFIIGATGPTVDARSEGGRRFERHVQTDVHDFAWTAWDQWQALEETIDGVRVRVLYPPSFRVDAQRELRTIRFALPHFSGRYGRYPYDVLTIVHPPYRADEAGGMEYPTLITTGGPWYGPPAALFEELVTIHEFGHQYFYGLLASNEVEWPFLDEGLNSYAEQLAMGEWRGSGSVGDVLGLTVSDATINAVGAHMGNHLSQRIAQPAYAFMTGNDYGVLVYRRSAALLETMRRVYGDDAVGRAMGRYARKNRFRHPVPEDLIAAFADVLGTKVAQTLRTALFDKGWVNYRVSDAQSHAAQGPGGVFDSEGKRETRDAPTAGDGAFEGWVVVTREGTLPFPVDVRLTRADGSTDSVRWDGEGDAIRIPYHGAAGLSGVVIDPDHKVILEERLTDNFRTIGDGARQGAPRFTERALYWAELLFQTVAP